MSATPILSLPLLEPSQAQKHVTHNEAVLQLDVLVQLSVASWTVASPPEAPQDGACHVVATGATGAWAGHDNAVAVYRDGSWVFYPPRSGWRAELPAEGLSIVYDGTGWSERGAQSQALLGVNATAALPDRLVVAGESTLLTHDGTGHQLKINKATPADTGSLLYQTNWSGRAELGLNGADAFSIKVSSDGSGWIEALVADPATGHVSGAAVQSSATDVTPGRLMRADYGYCRGNLVGAVGLSSGVPTGAVLETGSNANGRYLRFADGTQICAQTLDLDVKVGDDVQVDWTFPAAFSEQPHVMGTAPGGSGGFRELQPTGFRSLPAWRRADRRHPRIDRLGALATAAVVRNMRVTAIGRWGA